jgi:hypothetical protein
MRRVFARTNHRRALFALIAVLIGFSALADELSDDPQAKIRPPVGVQASQEAPPTVSVEPQNRILPPGGVAIRDEVEQGGLLDTFWTWLRIQLGVSFPIG